MGGVAVAAGKRTDGNSVTLACHGGLPRIAARPAKGANLRIYYAHLLTDRELFRATDAVHGRIEWWPSLWAFPRQTGRGLP